MTAATDPINLTHHFLIAMPGMEDGAFAKSVVYVCEHSDSGALGIVINKPSDLSMQSLFEKVSLTLRRPDLMNGLVMQGGPLQVERGFVLHDALWVNDLSQDAQAQAPLRSMCRDVDEAAETNAAQSVDGLNPAGSRESVYASTLSMLGGLEMTTSKDVLEALSMGAGPKRVLISLGYSAWGEGQLESELAENSWLTVGADTAVIFDTPVEQRYERAMKLLGLEPWMLSREAGHA